MNNHSIIVVLYWNERSNIKFQDLVDHLGINRGSIYATFIGKDELYQEAVNLYRSQNSEGLKLFLQNYPSVKEGIKALMHRNLNDVKCDPDRKGCFVVNCVSEYLPTHNDAVDIVNENKSIFIKGHSEVV